MEHSAKRTMKFFRAGRGVWGFVEPGHFNRHFKNISKAQENMSKIQEKKTPQGNILEIFFLETLKTIF